jgi:hypothetical protein
MQRPERIKEYMERINPSLKIWYILGLLLAFWLLIFLYVRSRTPAGPGAEALQGMTAFTGGQFEASGVADVPRTDGVLFVDNGKVGQVFWMRLDQSGKQVGPIKTIELGINIEDIEGITTDGTYFYVVSSQSRPKAISGAGLVRFKFDAASQSIGDVPSISGLKSLLVENVAELRDQGDRKSKDGGINIEGIAWDPLQGRLLVGLRSPVVDGQALLVPLSLRDPRGEFSVDNLEVKGSKAIRLKLGGVGIRGIEYDARAKVFRIISGAGEDQDQTDFGLWEWNGDEKKPVLREMHKFARDLKPEGVARATSGKRDFLIVVFDAGGYTTLD